MKVLKTLLRQESWVEGAGWKELYSFVCTLLDSMVFHSMLVKQVPGDSCAEGGVLVVICI